MTEQLLTIDEQFEALGWKNPEKEKFPNLVFNTESAENKYKRLQVAASVGRLDIDWLKITSNRIQEMITDPEATEVTLEDAGTLMFGLEEMASVVKPKTLRDKRDMRRLLIPKNFGIKRYYNNPKRKPFYFWDQEPNNSMEGHRLADLPIYSMAITAPIIGVGAGIGAAEITSQLVNRGAEVGLLTGVFAFVLSPILNIELYSYLEKTKYGRKVLWK